MFLFGFSICLVIDSWGKIPSGLYSGNFFDFGMFDQCLDVSHASDDGNTIKGQYCLPSISAEFETFSDTLRPSAIDLAGRIPVPTVDMYATEKLVFYKAF